MELVPLQRLPEVRTCLTCESGCSCPAEKVVANSPTGVNKRMVPSVRAATNKVEGREICPVPAGDAVRGFRNGRNLMVAISSSCGTTACAVWRPLWGGGTQTLRAPRSLQGAGPSKICADRWELGIFSGSGRNKEEHYLDEEDLLGNGGARHADGS